MDLNVFVESEITKHLQWKIINCSREISKQQEISKNTISDVK